VSKSIGVAVFVSTLVVAGVVGAQGMLLDFAADKVINGYRIPAQRYAGTHSLHRQDRRARFEQDV
jgi:hypothetical protein